MDIFQQYKKHHTVFKNLAIVLLLTIFQCFLLEKIIQTLSSAEADTWGTYNAISNAITAWLYLFLTRTTTSTQNNNIITKILNLAKKLVLISTILISVVSIFLLGDQNSSSGFSLLLYSGIFLLPPVLFWKTIGGIFLQLKNLPAFVFVILIVNFFIILLYFTLSALKKKNLRLIYLYASILFSFNIICYLLKSDPGPLFTNSWIVLVLTLLDTFKFVLSSKTQTNR